MGVLLLFAAGLCADDLPAPAELLKERGVPGQYVTVVEPHQSDSKHQTHVTYLAIPADRVLDRLFGHDWRSPDNDVVFVATDGYQYAASPERFMRYQAYRAHVRCNPAAEQIDRPDPPV